jgi:outer membrane lipoprotein SlyB
MNTKRKTLPAPALLALALTVVLTGCVTMPTGPSRMALPGSSKNFDEFRADDASCRQFALESAGGAPAQAQESSAVKSAVVGTVIGAAAGAAIGGSGRGAATGAGAGLLIGSAGGAAASDQSGYTLQRRYDDGYTQCMYAKGHRVAIPGGMSERAPVAPQPYYAPPPPPGSAPPPASSIVR